MPDAVKPEICLTGKLLYPVHIGLPAYIQEPDGYRRTSAVCAILADTQEATVSQSGSSGFTLERGKPNAEHKNKSGFTAQTGGVELSAPPVA